MEPVFRAYRFRFGSRRPAGRAMGPALKLIFFVCASFFVLAQVEPDLAQGFGLTPYFFWEDRAYWQAFTYQFVHFELWHLFLNLYVLWMFGLEIEWAWGPWRFLLFYLLCGVGAAIPPLSQDLVESGTTIGASGAISGVVAAHAVLYPDRKVLLFFFIPLRLSHAVWGLALSELLFQVFGIFPGISHAAHLGGLATGFLLLQGRGLSRRLRNRHYRKKLERLSELDSRDDWGG